MSENCLYEIEEIIKHLLLIGTVVVSKEKKTCIFFLIPYGVHSKGSSEQSSGAVFRNDWI
jgi:hypothetical protein